MCTVSVIRPVAAGHPDPVLLRMVVNRDERRTRPAAIPPMAIEGVRARAVMPTDPMGSGTWVAATDAGLVFALLNGAEPEMPAGIARVITPSRGRIIPGLLDCRSVDEVRDRVLSLDPRTYRPWRLVVASAARLLEAESTGSRIRHFVSALPRRFMTTSSSVLESRATTARVHLFEDLVREPDPAAQDGFHCHQWPDLKSLSVRMERPDACTVSRSVIEVHADRVKFAYEAVGSAGQATIDLARHLCRRGAA
jgi:hypothetical protein